MKSRKRDHQFMRGRAILDRLDLLDYLEFTLADDVEREAATEGEAHQFLV